MSLIWQHKGLTEFAIHSLIQSVIQSVIHSGMQPVNQCATFVSQVALLPQDKGDAERDAV